MNAHLLAVEDTPALRALLQLCLTRAGYKVDLAEDGQTAVKMFLAGAYDAVIMDIQMPVMDGLTAITRMRGHEKNENRASVPILALTANTEPSDLRKCLEAGFTGTLRKPFARKDLLRAVEQHLKIKATPSVNESILVTADPEFADLIPPFLDNCRHEAEAMRRALERHDYRAIAAASHKLAGAGASFGFQPLSDESHLIEAAAKAVNDTALLKSLETLDRYLKQVRVIYP